MSLKVCMIGVEMTPYSKVGGMGDVLGALPAALGRLGCDVTAVIPLLPSTDQARWGIRPTDVEVTARVDGAWRRARVLEARSAVGARVLFIDYPPYFDRPGLYGTPAGDHPDNAQRFAFFCYAALEACRRLAAAPDVVHTHDWQSGLVPFLLKAGEHYATVPDLAGAVSVHTIHNLSYQGLFPSSVLPSLGVDWSHLNFRELEFYGLVNFLKAGLVFADAITTVSPSYATEIQSVDYAWGLQGVLVERRDDLVGIVNGIDTEAWDPATDGALAACYDATRLGQRQANAHALRQEMGLPEDGRPLVGVVNRLVAQKGMDLILGLADRLEVLGLQWAILGSGDANYEVALKDLARLHPETVAVQIGFDEGLARRIYAGSDLFCMPSFFEPCGLGQMIAMRYGSIPVVRRTGGLADTVRDVAEPGGVGVVFDGLTAPDLEAALVRARKLLADEASSDAVRRRAMARDFSWSASARKYLELYSALRARKTG